MSNVNFALISVLLGVGTVMVALAIVVWARRRDMMWTFTTIAILALYGRLLFDIIIETGFVRLERGSLLEFSLIHIALSAGPMLLFIIALIAEIKNSNN